MIGGSNRDRNLRRWWLQRCDAHGRQMQERRGGGYPTGPLQTVDARLLPGILLLVPFLAAMIAVVQGGAVAGPAREAFAAVASDTAMIGAANPATPAPGTTVTDTQVPAMTATAIPGPGTATTAIPTPGTTATDQATPIAAQPSRSTAVAQPSWQIRSVDTMKLSRDTLKEPLSDAQIAAVVRLDAGLHLTHVTADVYYDDPAYLGRWVRAIRQAGLHVWFRPHWYGWEDHRDRRGSMTPAEYIDATRLFIQEHADLFANGDIFDFCPEPENGAYWLHTFGNGWSWKNPDAKSAFNTFIRSGLYMANTTLGNRGRDGVQVTVVSVNTSIAQRMLSKPTVRRLGLITLDLYSEGKTRDPRVAAQRLLAEVARVHSRWKVPVLIGEHGYARDIQVDDATQARVLAAELQALAHVPYIIGLNYWVDAGGPGYGGYTNLYRKVGAGWKPRSAAAVLAQLYASMAGRRA